LPGVVGALNVTDAVPVPVATINDAKPLFFAAASTQIAVLLSPWKTN
jgi:hypothetical protein